MTGTDHLCADCHPGVGTWTGAHGTRPVPPNDRRCMGYTRRGERCTRRWVYGEYENGRHVLCIVHARLAGWRLW